MGVADKIAEIEAEIARTQVNKATEHHLGLLKAKLAKLKRESEARAGKGGGGAAGAFSVRKSGNATVVFIGLPSVGKSSLLNALTGAKSKTASYAFTTLSVIPGMMRYKGANIQLLDLPGIIAGAKGGRGRGREVLSVARNADLVLLVLDVFDPFYVTRLKEELEGIGVRLDVSPPNIVINEADKGGLEIHFDKRPTHLNEKLVAGILKEYGIMNGSVTFREDATIDRLIDALVRNRTYAASLVVVNKTDLVKPEFLKTLDFDYVPVSASTGRGVDALREAIFQKLRLMRVFTKSRFDAADVNEPLMLRSGATVGDACDHLHRDLRKLFKFAQVWGPSAKYPGQRVGLEHALRDGDTLYVHKR